MCLEVLSCTKGKASNRAIPILLPLVDKAVPLNPLQAVHIGQPGEFNKMLGIFDMPCIHKQVEQMANILPTQRFNFSRSNFLRP
jgi:hypothetical protein